MRTNDYCDGMRRRDFLRWGSASVFGMGLSLPEILRAEAKAKTSSDVSLIIVFLKGGLSTIDTWDLKPDAPAEFRGEFKPIKTNVNGIQLGEHLPKMATRMDKISLIRSFTHGNSGHGPADHIMLTGHHPRPGFNASLKPNNQRPAHGAVIAKTLGPRGSMPPYVCLPKIHNSGGSAYLGSSAAPFVIESDPNAPNFSVPDLAPPAAVSTDRLANRKELLARVDRFRKSAETRANRDADAVETFQQKAFDLMTSAEVRKAFNVASEPAKLREQYGRNSLGQSCLMARRLIQAGARCVTIDHSNWDTHNANFDSLKNDLLPKLDAAASTLFADLSQRGMLDKTLVLITGEFGRTPRINKNAGRDHWGPVFTVALGGGGIKGGRVIGTSDAKAEKPNESPMRPGDLFATAYRLMGIDPEAEFYTPEGRPLKIVDRGKVIRELL